jgi:predicted acetyltransferase
MKIEVSPASIHEKATLQNLMQLYLYDFSEMAGDEVDDTGRFSYAYLDRYWTEPERHPFLVRVDEKLAGFVLVRQAPSLVGGAPESGATCTQMAEFFILRKYQRQGIGARAARALFDRFPGRWEVCEIPDNIAARDFWRKMIGEYTGGDYQEYFLENEQWRGPVQVFEAGRLEE